MRHGDKHSRVDWGSAGDCRRIHRANKRVPYIDGTVQRVGEEEAAKVVEGPIGSGDGGARVRYRRKTAAEPTATIRTNAKASAFRQRAFTDKEIVFGEAAVLRNGAATRGPRRPLNYKDAGGGHFGNRIVPIKDHAVYRGGNSDGEIVTHVKAVIRKRYINKGRPG